MITPFGRIAVDWPVFAELADILASKYLLRSAIDVVGLHRLRLVRTDNVHHVQSAFSCWSTLQEEMLPTEQGLSLTQTHRFK